MPKLLKNVNQLGLYLRGGIKVKIQGYTVLVPMGALWQTLNNTHTRRNMLFNFCFASMWSVKVKLAKKPLAMD